MDPVIVFGLTASAIVVAAIQVAKALGLPVAPALGATLAASMSVIALGLLIRFLPPSQPCVEGVVQVFFVFLVATGLYHAGKNVKKNDL